MVKQMSVGELEEVLHLMPDAFTVKVRLFGDFDLSDLSRQASEIIPGARLMANAESTYSFANTKKEQILQMYHATVQNYPAADGVMADFSDATKKYPELSTAERMRRMREYHATLLNGQIMEKALFLDSIYWMMEGVSVTLTPTSALIQYEGTEPESTAAVKKVFEKIGIKLTVDREDKLIKYDSK